MSSAQSAEGRRKTEKPGLYCPTRGCLWMTGDGRKCPRHGGPPWTRGWEQLARMVSRGDISVAEAHRKEVA